MRAGNLGPIDMQSKIKARAARRIDLPGIRRRLTLPVGAFSIVLLGAMPALLPSQLSGGKAPTAASDPVTVASVRTASLAPIAIPSPLEAVRTPVAPLVDEEADEARKNPFVGEWRGVGWLARSNGPREQLNCRATHSERGEGEQALHVLRCGNERFQIDLTSSLRQRDGKISGSWRESNHNLRGGVNGTQRGERLSLFLRSDNLSASLHATVNGCRQSIGITINEWHERRGYVSLKKVGC
jgi:hypothetical protein